jgi:hypothetical protein
MKCERNGDRVIVKVELDDNAHLGEAFRWSNDMAFSMSFCVRAFENAVREYVDEYGV